MNPYCKGIQFIKYHIFKNFRFQGKNIITSTVNSLFFFVLSHLLRMVTNPRSGKKSHILKVFRIKIIRSKKIFDALKLKTLIFSKSKMPEIKFFIEKFHHKRDKDSHILINLAFKGYKFCKNPDSRNMRLRLGIS